MDYESGEVAHRGAARRYAAAVPELTRPLRFFAAVLEEDPDPANQTGVRQIAPARAIQQMEYGTELAEQEVRCKRS